MKYETFNHQDLSVVMEWLNNLGAHKVIALFPQDHSYVAIVEIIKMGRPSGK